LSWRMSSSTAGFAICLYHSLIDGIAIGNEFVPTL